MKSWRYKVKRVADLPLIEFEGMRLNFLIQKEETDRMAAYFIRMPRRTIVPPSYHKVAQEIIIVLAGKGEARLNRATVPIKKGDVLLVKPRTWHSFKTAGATMRLLAVTSPYVDSKTDLYHH